MLKLNMDAVILAAGLSSRTGTFKLELELSGKSILRHTIDTIRNFSSQQIVVAGYKMHKVVEIARGCPGLRVAFNPNYETGMFSSVKQGIKYVTADWFFFIPGDIPLVLPSTYEALLKAREENPEGLVFIPVHEGLKRKGHPILINSVVKDQLLTEPVESNLKCFIDKTGFIPVPVQDEAIILDVDTMEDFQKAKEMAESRGK